MMHITMKSDTRMSDTRMFMIIILESAGLTKVFEDGQDTMKMDQQLELWKVNYETKFLLYV